MAVLTGQITSYGVPENARDVSAAFYLIDLPNTPLLNVVETPYAARNTRHNWWDDARQPIATTLGAGYTSGGGTLTVASSAGLREGSIIQVGSVVYRVTAINSATSIDVVVADSGSDSDQDNGAKVTFIGNAKAEGAEYEDSDMVQKVERYNVTQIMDDFVKLTGTQQSIDREVGGADQVSEEVTKKLNRLYLSLARALWSNPRVAPSDNATARVLGGVDYFIGANGYAPSAASFTRDNFDAFVREMEEEYGAVPMQAWMNPAQIALFDSLMTDKVRLDRADRTTGGFVSSYETKYGHSIDLMTDPNAPVGPIRLFNASDIKLLPLQGRQWQVIDLAKTGDNTRKQILGEYTAEVWNSSRMGMFTPS